jgi:tetratricopeptide (TPR) repeat protein
LSRAVTVAAALIVQNEERFLAGCLESLRGRVDEIVVVDTGSQDASPRIAAAFGARIVVRRWTGDFSAARNAGLDAVESDWVLYIDADERLGLPKGGAVADYIVPAALAQFVRFRPKTGYTRYREARLFRSDPRLRFAGQIHETMTPVLVDLSAREGLPILNSSVEIDHLGYDGDQTAKHARNLPLLERAAREQPGRVYYWHHLAETFAALGRPGEALAAAARGLAAAEGEVDEKQRADASMIFQTMARLQREQGQDPLAVIERGLALCPSDHGLRFLRARALLDAERPENALEDAETLRSVNPDDLNDGLLAFDKAIFGEKACEIAALACLRLGRREAAADWFAEAARLVPDSNLYRLKAAAIGRRDERQ